MAQRPRPNTIGVKKKTTKVKKSVAKKATAKKIVKKVVKKVAKPQTGISSVRGREKPIGKVSHYFDKIKVAAIKLKAPLKKGNTIRIEGGTAMVKVTISSMQKNHKPVASAKAKDEIGIKVSKKVREGYRVFKV